MCVVKKVKKVLGFILTLSVIITLLYSDIIKANELDGDNIVTRAGSITYKTNVRNYEEWGSYARISDNVKITAGQFVTIYSNRSVSFSRTISGTTTGLTIAANQTVTSNVGHVAETSTAGTWYLVYRPRYKVEAGNRNHQPRSGSPVTTNSYTVKVPCFGEYKLIKN